MNPKETSSVTSGPASQMSKMKGMSPSVTSTHGMKLSLNTPSEKKDFILRFEKWRQDKREKLISQNRKGSTPLKISQLQSNKILKQSVTPNQNKNKDSVFDRLYRGSKIIKNEKTTGTASHFIKPAQFSGKLNNWSVTVIGENLPNEEIQLAKTDDQNIDRPTESQFFSNEDENKENIQTVHAVPCAEVVVASRDEIIPKEININEHQIDLTDNAQAKADVLLEILQDNDENNFENVLHDDAPNTDVLKVPEVQSDHIQLECNMNEQIENSKARLEENAKTNSEKIISADAVEGNKFVVPKPMPPVKTTELKEAGKSNTTKPKNPVRRSISMLYRKKGGIRRSSSEKNLNDLESCIHRTKLNIKPTSFSYEDALDRKNNMSTKSLQLFSPRIKKGTTSSSLRNNLEEWLEVHGHSLDGYRHLRCFGISVIPENLTPAKKERQQIEKKDTIAEEVDEESLLMNHQTSPQECPEPNMNDCENWLKELHRLIVELKYPVERCEEWLAAIRLKCPKCTELPIYWECLAVVNADSQPVANQEATKTITGEEVEAVASLFDKMVIEQNKPQSTKLEKGLDPKNIFHSTVIKFALQEKNIRDSGKKTGTQDEAQVNRSLIATPVRRSSRIQTPVKKKNVVDSLQSLTPDVQNFTFKANESLFNRL